MKCAVVELTNGRKFHYTNVLECWVGKARGKAYAKLRLADESIVEIESAIMAKLVDDDWYVINQLGIGL